jgi:hypothetical protein
MAMKRLCVSAVLAVLSISLCFAQSTMPQAAGAQGTSAQAAPSNPDNQIKGSFPVKLEKSIDSKKLKEGDTVVCQTVTAVHSRSGLMIPSGAKVIGHVTQAQARSKGDSDSTLAITFDKIEYAKGEEIPMKGTLQAVGPSLGGQALDTSASPPQLSTASHGATGGSSGGSSPPPTSSMQISGPSSGTPILRPTSQGVLGVKNLQMDTNGVLTSPAKEVKLDSGMQLMIKAEIDLPSRQ